MRPVEGAASFAGVTLHWTPGRHGHGGLAERMGPVSGFVIEGDETLSVAGDTVWYEPVAETLGRFEPDAVVLNAGAARFNHGEPITMVVDDAAAVREATDAAVAAVHMEAINHWPALPRGAPVGDGGRGRSGGRRSDRVLVARLSEGGVPQKVRVRESNPRRDSLRSPRVIQFSAEPRGSRCRSPREGPGARIEPASQPPQG